jgi:hypothetical protein
MALFTDGAVASIEDLKGHDTQLLNVATIEDIDVTRKLALAHEEISIELAGLLEQAMQSGQLTAPPSIDQIVVTMPLKLWHIFRTLEMVYRDAFNSQLNDRYGGKRDEYHDLAKWAYGRLIQDGLGMATNPVKQATTPEPWPSAGSITDGAYYVAIAWTNAAGDEGAASTPAMIQVSGSSFAVQTKSPADVAGWNVYCGTSPSTMTIQNGPALIPGQVWIQSEAVSTAGRLAGNGQMATYRLQVPRMIQRG